MNYLEKIMQIEGAVNSVECQELIRLAEQAEDCIVEIGSWKGRSTVALACGSRMGNNVPVYAIDPHDSHTSTEGRSYGPEDNIRFLENILKSGYADLIQIINLPSNVTVKAWQTLIVEDWKFIDLLFVDGNHDYKEVKKDFRSWEPFVKDNGYIAMHDSTKEGPAKEIKEAHDWEIVKTVGTLCILRRK